MRCLRTVVVLLLTMSLVLMAACGGGGGGKKKKSLRIATDTLDPSTEGKPYLFQVEGVGGKKPYGWAISVGSLPSGLSLDPLTGEISGIPAPGESGSSPFRITVELTDSGKIPGTVTKVFLLVVEQPGGVGGGPMQGTVTVTVVEAETGLPISGAFAMIGPAPDDPFTGNYGTTDANGEITFTDAALDSPAVIPPVTAGATGRQYLTILSANAAEFTLPLKLIVNPRTVERVSGMVTGQGTSAGNVHAAFVIPPIKLTELFNFRIENLFVGEECVCVACGKINLPGNLSYFAQDVSPFPLGDDMTDKGYFMDFGTGSTQHLAAGAGYIDALDLLSFISGGNPNRISLFTNLQVESFGIVPDVTVTAPMVQDIPLTIPADPADAVDVSVLESPRGSDVFIATGADITAGDGTGQLIASDFGFAPRDQALPMTDTLAAVPDTIPGIIDPFKVVIAAAFFDPYSNVNPLPTADVEFAFSFLTDRTTPFSSGNIDVAGFLDLMPLDAAVHVTGGGRTFTYPTASDLANPRSPVPDWSLSQIVRTWVVTPPPPVDPFPGQVCPPQMPLLLGGCDDGNPPPGCAPPSDVRLSEIFWEVFTPGSLMDTTFDLPILPPTAPRAAVGGLFDVAATPEPDVTRWSLLSFAATLDPDFSYDSFTFGSVDDGVTHVSFNYVEY